MEDIKQHVEPKKRHIGSKKRVMPDCAIGPAVETKPDTWAQTGRSPPDPLIETFGHQVPQPCYGPHAASVERRRDLAGSFEVDQEVMYQPDPTEEQVARERSWSGRSDVHTMEYRDHVGPTILQSRAAASCVGGPPIQEVQRRMEYHSVRRTDAIHRMAVGHDRIQFSDPLMVQDSAGRPRLSGPAGEAVFELGENTMVGVISALLRGIEVGTAGFHVQWVRSTLKILSSLNVAHSSNTGENGTLNLELCACNYLHT